MEIRKKRPGHKLKCASQAEIIRSHQRDDAYIKGLQEKVIDLLQPFAKKNNLLYLIYSDIPYKLIYFVFTSGMGNQTLGEEYTGIVQANLKASKVPTLTARIIAAIFECFGERTLLNILKRLQQSVNHPHSELTPAAVAFFNSLLSKMYIMLPSLIMIHKGLFYIYGQYYSLGKRISGIDYAKVYGHRPTDGVSWALRLLGIATLAQCALKVWQTNNNDVYDDKCVSINDKHSKYMCHLCLERASTTTTPCGHLFCWFCISDWLNNQSQCPLCRQHVMPSRIVYIMNL